MSREASFLTADMREVFKHTVAATHPLQEQFRDYDHQNEVARMGMWLFLATEIMFFGTLFLVLGIYRYLYAVPFEVASQRLNWQIGGINTIVLLVSSLMMVLAVHYAKHGQRQRCIVYLLLTALLGAAFLGFKAWEYYLDYQEFLIPGWRFRPEEWVDKFGLAPGQVPNVELFLMMYWITTVTHAVHMTIGIGVVLVLAILAARGKYTADHYAPIDVTGLYWHFVDIVWIFLLPMLYLQGTHTWGS